MVVVRLCWRKDQRWFYADEGQDWGDLEITAQGMRIKSVLNGTTVVDYDGTGVLEHELHRKANIGIRGMIRRQIHSGEVIRLQFKDIGIKEL